MIFSAWRDTSSFCSRHTFVRGIDSQETVPASSVVHPAALLVSEAVFSASTTRDVSELPRTDDSTMLVRHAEIDVPLPEVTELDLQRALDDDFRPTTPREIWFLRSSVFGWVLIVLFLYVNLCLFVVSSPQPETPLAGSSTKKVVEWSLLLTHSMVRPSLRVIVDFYEFSVGRGCFRVVVGRYVRSGGPACGASYLQ